MTLPYERTNAVVSTGSFLRSLLDPKQTPRVPKSVRDRAYALLRHYPSQGDMEIVSAREDGEEQPITMQIFGKDSLSMRGILSDNEIAAHIRAIMGPPMRTLEGEERDAMLVTLNSHKPFKETNNQRSWTDYFLVDGIEYHVTTFSADDIIVEQVL